MKLLVYRWGSVSEPLFCETIKQLNIKYVEYAGVMKDYHFDAEFAKEIIELIHGEKVGMVFSYDYFPLLSMLCEINKIPYVSWIYDCPQYTLYSKTLKSPYNHIFCFDRIFAERLKEMGAVHCEHYPLAGDLQMLERSMGQGKDAAKLPVADDAKEVPKACDISFIGNLYNDEKNRFRKAKFSPYVAGYIEGVVQAQQPLYGKNLIREALVACPNVVEELVEKCELSLSEQYVQDELQLAADVLGMEVSAREREEVLRVLCEHFPVRLYTASQLPEGIKNGNLEKMGYADYEKELPLIYHNSKINLNITSKTIESGIPQRIFDILSCGGFCITNYQPEIVAYFEDGKELVMYHSMEDLLQKAAYYLEHDEERKRIAENGRRKIEEHFSMKERVWGMLETATRKNGIYEELTAPVSIKDIKAEVENFLKQGEVEKVQEVLQKNKNILKNDNELANMHYLSFVCSKESSKGNVTAYKSSMEETLSLFYELQYMVRRLEWWDDFDKEEIFKFMETNKLSVYELQWAVESSCIEKGKVWRLLGE